MSELRRYTDYKDSGVPWLGEIPSHWEAKRIKFVVNNINKKVEASETELRYFGLENIESFTGKLKNHIELISEGVGNEFGSGDVLFGKLRPYLSKVYLTNQAGLASTEALILRSTESIEPKFLKYYCLSPDFIDQVNGTTFGSKMPRASWDGISSFKITYPNLDEQQAIVNFLDSELEHIDMLISKQQQLIEKLAEQCSAVITHAVTKGLDPNVPMKKSGIEWIGDIPEHWEGFKITHLIETIGSGTTPKSSNYDYYGDEGVLWVTTSELRESVITDTKKKLTEAALEDYSTLKVFPKNSVAIAMYGATIGRLGILGEEATFNQACCVYSESEMIHYKFLYYWLWYRRPILISLSNGGGQPNLNQDDLRKLKIPIPSMIEQKEIVDYLDKETQKIDQMSESNKSIVAKLQEYRAALITQAVTGKIDVRDIATGNRIEEMA